jgi:hypothetical protein
MRKKLGNLQRASSLRHAQICSASRPAGGAMAGAIKSGLAMIACGATLLAGTAKADAWPRLTGERDNPQCQQAYRLATSAFHSTNTSLAWPIDAPKDLGSTFSVYRRTVDISGGDALANDPKTFSRVEPTAAFGRPAPVFWQIEPRDGHRLAVVDQPSGWRGDRYSIYLLDATTPPDAVLADAGREVGRRFSPILDEQWTPPLVLSDVRSGTVWFFNPGEPYPFLPEWRVHTVEKGTLRSPCVVAFRPEMKTAVSLLPEPVRRLAASLDDALGPGADEGTLHPTARIRIDVAQGWANASLRPWAVSDHVYNTREQVEAGLRGWASGSSRRTAVYRAIQRDYPAAERALATYYERRFKLSSRQAHEQASYVADLMLRSYFFFHVVDAEGYAQGARNPWPTPTPTP